MQLNIVNFRLANQRLGGKGMQSPQEAVNWLGAIQAQDFNASKWSLGQRVIDSTSTKIDEAFNEGQIIRTHIMRPTWHFVTPEDLVWVQKLTSANVKRLMGHYNKKLELTDEVFKTTEKILIKNLKSNNYLTRQEIKKLLQNVGIETNVQRLAHIVMWPELDAIICSGPLKGKQFTYALVQERITTTKKLSREESLATLATKYFQSHCPAQLKDFAWWSGLSIKESQEALSMIKSKLAKENVNGKKYLYLPSRPTTNDQRLTAFLLSIYDEYVIAYKDRSDLSENPKDIEKMISMGNALTSVIVSNGKVAGTWKRLLKKDQVQISLNLFRKPSPGQKELLKKETKKYADFLNKSLEVLWT